MVTLELPWWSAIFVVVPVLAFLGWGLYSILSKWNALDRLWHSLEGVIPFSYASTAPVDEERLIKNVNSAFAALVTYGPWSRSELWAALAHVKVDVVPMENWPGPDGKKVAGVTFQEASMVVINASMASLCHELAHLAEIRLEGKTDYTHESWLRRGITGATIIYEGTKV